MAALAADALHMDHAGEQFMGGLGHVAMSAELEEQIYRLSQEKRDLQDYADRVAKELRRYQQARPDGPPPGRPEDELPLPPWASNMQMMSPLLFAYEERIAELEAVIERSVRITESTAELTKENDKLRSELQNSIEQLRSAKLTASRGEGPGDSLAGGEPAQLDELHEMYRLAVEQNEMLAQQNQLLKVQMERMRHSVLATQQQTREAQVAAAHGSRAHSAVEERAETLQRQRSAAEQRLEEVTGELVEEVKAREDLEMSRESMQHELQLKAQSLDRCQKSFDERCHTAQEEEDRLKADLNRIQRSEKEHSHRSLKLEQELANVTDQLFVARRDGDTAKQDLEQTVKLTVSMERRLLDIGQERETLQVNLLDAESQVSGLVHEKDRLASSEQALRQKADRNEARLTGDLEALRQQLEQEHENLKVNHRRAFTDLEDKHRKSEHAASEHSTRAELLGKRHLWESSALERQTQIHAAERSKLTEDVEDSQQHRLRLERQSNAMQQEAARLRTDLDAASNEVREHSNRHGSELSAHHSRRESVERSLSQAREEAHALEVRVASVSAESSKRRDELLEERHVAADAVEVERRKAQSEKRTLQRQLQNITARHQQDKQRALDLLQATDQLNHKWQSEFDVEREAFETQVERLTSENRVMREKSRSALKLAMQRLAAAGTGEEDAAGVAAPSGLAANASYL